MAATSRAFHTRARWSTTEEAASAASFQPSKAAMRTGDLSWRHVLDLDHRPSLVRERASDGATPVAASPASRRTGSPDTM